MSRVDQNSTPAEVLVCAPSWAEARYLRRGLPGLEVRVTGIGPRRPLFRSAVPPKLGACDNDTPSGVVARAHFRRGPALVVAGIAGGLDPDLRPGDVVVATEVRGPDGRVSCPGAPLLAGQLARSGLPVRTGPILSTDHVVGDAERRRLAGSGALAVDMESSWLAGQAAEAALAVVRVIADPAGSPLWRPATLPRLTTALRRLALLGPGLQDWIAAVGPRRVLLPGPRSFCAGVVRAIDVVDQALLQRGAPVYVRKEIVHNSHVVTDLRRRGAVFVESLDDVPDAATLIFSAHGVAPSVRTQAVQRGLQVIDATCPLVSKVHAEVRRFADDGRTVLFIGHRGHDETIGTMGERPARTILVESVGDAEEVEVADPERVSYLVQTTLAADEVSEIIATLQRRFPSLRGPASDDICYATTNRQAALRAVAGESDLCLVVGSANSSNSLRLVELAERCGSTAHLVDDASEIDLRWLAGARTVAVTAGASAPAALVDEITAALTGLGPVQVEHRELTHETTTFTLPKEIRAR